MGMADFIQAMYIYIYIFRTKCTLWYDHIKHFTVKVGKIFEIHYCKNCSIEQMEYILLGCDRFISHQCIVHYVILSTHKITVHRQEMILHENQSHTYNNYFLIYEKIQVNKDTIAYTIK